MIVLENHSPFGLCAYTPEMHVRFFRRKLSNSDLACACKSQLTREHVRMAALCDPTPEAPHHTQCYNTESFVRVYDYRHFVFFLRLNALQSKAH